MSGMTSEVIIRYTLDGIGEGEVAFHLAHILCLSGRCEIVYNHNLFTIEEKDCAIIRTSGLIESIRASEDLSVMVVYVDPVFIEKSTPNNNYGMRGSLSLAQDPVMHLNDEEFRRCKKNFEEIARRKDMVWHHFMDEMMISVIQTMILDFYDFHMRINGHAEIQTQSASVMRRFMTILESGEYRKNREVSYYASELCVTPKYLSEISKSISGNSASWWINRFTILDISRQLRDRSQSFTEISDMFNFSSLSYFCRYVQRYLGMSPSEYRG